MILDMINEIATAHQPADLCSRSFRPHEPFPPELPIELSGWDASRGAW